MSNFKFLILKLGLSGVTVRWRRLSGSGLSAEYLLSGHEGDNPQAFLVTIYRAEYLFSGY